MDINEFDANLIDATGASLLDSEHAEFLVELLETGSVTFHINHREYVLEVTVKEKGV